MENFFICPHCGNALHTEGNSLFCNGVRRHCFDISAEGYVNLTLPDAAGGGDDGVLIAARRAFLCQNHYRPIAEKTAELLNDCAPGRRVLDAGCGEGYYTNFLAASDFNMVGIDLSKKGIRAAAKTAEKEGLSAQYAVAGIFSLPLAEECFDAVVSLFAPVAEREFLRVLRPGGILLRVAAGRSHLLELKRVLYETLYENEERADTPVLLQKEREEELSFDMKLSGQEIRDLFTMTPYYYRTPKAGHQRLAALETLTCSADVRLTVYRKKGTR